MSTTKNYSTLPEWLEDDIHTKDVNIGPQGNVDPGHISIRGDRFQTGRILVADAPSTTLSQGVVAARIEKVTNTLTAGNSTILVVSNNDFIAGDRILIEDSTTPDNKEVQKILTVSGNEVIIIDGSFDNSYSPNNNCFVSQTKTLIVDSVSGFAKGDIISLQKKEDSDEDFEYYNVEVYAFAIGLLPGEGQLDVYYLFNSFSIDDNVYNFNHDSYVRDGINSPIVDLQREYYWNALGCDVGSPTMLKDVDILKEADDEIVYEKPGLWITGSRERGSGQISLLVSENKTDIYDWTQFLGAKNILRENPVIRNSNSMVEFFNYTSTDEMKKLWDTEDASITVSLDVTSQLEGVSTMQIDYTDSGEVWGLCPLPFNADIRNDGAFSFSYRGNALNEQGDLFLKIVGADGTQRIINQSNKLQATGTFTVTADEVSDFAARKWVRALAVGVSLAAPGTGTMFIDSVDPFVPATWDEIVEDPAPLKGTKEGSLACYYTARKRPRQIITVNASLAGNPNGDVQVADESDFQDGDIVVIYNRDNSEIGIVTGISSGHVLFNHIGYEDDNTVTFQNNYRTDNQSMIANNTFKENFIGASFVLNPNDISDWNRYLTDNNSTKIFSPNTNVNKFDSQSVKQPSIKKIGDSIYMAYAGSCVTTPNERIGVAFSTDYINFTRLNDGDPYLELGSGGEFDENGLQHPDLEIMPPFNNLMYTGKDSANDRTIGSAYGEIDIYKKNLHWTVGMLVWAGATLGMPPEDGSVLFDMGTARIEVDRFNRVQAFCKVRGESEEKHTPLNDYMAQIGVQGDTLWANRWNYIAMSFNGNKLWLNIINCGMYLDFDNIFYQTQYLLFQDALPGATSVLLIDNLNVPWSSTDPASRVSFGGSGTFALDTEIGFKGLGTAERYTGRETIQYSTITGMSVIAPGVLAGTSVYHCTLRDDTPIGAWGYNAQKNGIAGQTIGVLIASCQDTPGSSFRKLFDGTYYFMDIAYPYSKEINLGDSFAFLDEKAIRDLTVGNKIGNGKPYHTGHIAFVELMSGIGSNDVFLQRFRTLMDDSHGAFGPATWDRFDKTGVGAYPNDNFCIAQWKPTDYESANNKIPDDVGRLDLYLYGTSEVLNEGFLGNVLFHPNRPNNKSVVPLLAANFTKRNSGAAQFEKDSSVSIDDNEVSASNLIKNNNAYRLLYTGWGKEPYRDVGLVIGDLFESGSAPAGITFNMDVTILAGTTVGLYCSWKKRTSWTEVTVISSTGDQNYTGCFDISAIPDYEDLFYNVKWKVELHANADNNKSPILRTMAATYDSASYPSQAFLDAQDSTCKYGIASVTPIHKVQLVKSSDPDNEIDITSRVKQILNINREIPSSPAEFSNLFLDSCTLQVENTDGYFSENRASVAGASPPFYNRVAPTDPNGYLEDEIRFFAGFDLDGTLEYLTTGRFVINYIKADSESNAEIYCRSILDAVAEVTVGQPELDETVSPPVEKEKPRKFISVQPFKTIMTELLNVDGGIGIEKIHIEDVDMSFSNIILNEANLGTTIQQLAQAAQGIVYTNNQGDVYFKKWTSFPSSSLHFRENTNSRSIRHIGQNRDSILKECTVKGDKLQKVYGISVSATLTIGRTKTINSDFIQSNELAQDIADFMITNFTLDNSEIELSATYLPSIDVTHTVQVTSPILGLAGAYYLVYRANKGLTNYQDEYFLKSNFAIKS